MTTMTTEQTQLREYAQAVLRQYGVKANQARWVTPEVLALIVDPTAVEKARRLLPLIETRARKYDNLRVVIDEPGAELGLGS
jgi:hypothetical protein